MCGIIAVLRRPRRRGLRRTLSAAGRPGSRTRLDGPSGSRRARSRSRRRRRRRSRRSTPPCGGVRGVQALLEQPDRGRAHRGPPSTPFRAGVDALERALDAGESGCRAPSSRRSTPPSSRSRTRCGRSRRDRLRTAAAVAELAGPDAGAGRHRRRARPIQLALSAIDRLEVRGRDSAGSTSSSTGHGLDLSTRRRDRLARAHDPLFTSTARADAERPCSSFVYKAAAEIGELGDNTARAARRHRRRRAAAPGPRAADDAPRSTVLGHTRWASVGIISEANAHPLNHEERAAAATRPVRRRRAQRRRRQPRRAA